MGLPIPWMRLIIREHKKEPFKGKVLTLGRMAVLANYEEVVNLFSEEGVKPQPLDDNINTLTNIPSFKKMGDKYSNFTSDIVFFKLLGVESIEIMDVSDYENADITHDLNLRVPKILEGAFDSIFDFGTSEHIFNTKQILDNYNLMLKTGGRILHGLPSTNRVGHGFFMFSPELFYDYYMANKFIDTRAYLVESNRGDPSFVNWKLYEYGYDTYKSIASSFKSPNALGTFFVAQKTGESTFGVVPQQGQFIERFRNNRVNKSAAVQNVSIIASIKRYIPRPIKMIYYLIMRTGRFKILFQSRASKAGLRYLGKI